MCLAACKEGFVRYCRSLISLDACHLKGVVVGQLLATVGIDGNDGMHPIAYAIAKAELDMVLENLIGDIGPVRDHGWCFISCQQKGLLIALIDVVPDAYNKFCVKHLFANFKKNHKGKELKDLMWGATKSLTTATFEIYMKQMKIVSKEACDELRGRFLLQWAKHVFPYYPKCNMLLNNLCETFNSKIVEAREKPLVNMLETIRRYLMVRIRKNRDSMAKYEGPICHKI